MTGFGTEPKRYLCSHLVTLRWEGEARVVNLEEIWRTGASLESEEQIPSGVQAEMFTDRARFLGTVTAVEAHDLGWRVDLEFSPLTPWSQENFEPDHLLDPSSLK